jgi:hypothetical protein
VEAGAGLVGKAHGVLDCGFDDAASFNSPRSKRARADASAWFP